MRLTDARATRIFLAHPKVASWLHRYPTGTSTTATYSDGVWQINVFYGPAGEIASGKVTDSTAQVTEAFTGPQVAWGMARGGNGFGGKKINEWQTWLVFCVAFLLGLVDWRRPLSLRTVDLLALLSFSPSLWFFNHGRIFAAISLVYPGFAWLIGRCLWIAHRDRGSRGSVVWPTWVLVAATLCLAGYRIDLNINHSNVIDVGLSGVIGADRIARFQDPYGNFPVEDGRPNCGPADASGEVRDHIQTNGRCEAADPQGDTYGPVAYLAYVPGYIFLGWSGLWDSLPMAHFTTILWDLLAIIGLWFVGVRFGGPRLGAVFSFAWVAWPFTQYSSSSNTNDLIAPALLIWGFYFLTSPVKRGLFAAFSAWTKFASLVVVPLWSAYPDARKWRPRSRFVWGFLGGTALSYAILLLDPSPVHAVRVFYDHTFTYQFGRASPFSLWDWRQYHAKGLPNLRWVQRVLFGTLVAGSMALAWWPRRRSPLRMAAYTGALLIGFESVLTHWSWLYLPWFFPFVAIALLTPRLVGPVRIVAHPLAEQERIVQRTWSERQRLVAKFAAASAVFLCCWGLIGHGFYSKPSIIDVGLYQIYGSDIRDGEVPYRDFALEYPPGALPVFVAPTVSQRHYRRDFSWLMTASGVLCIAFLTLARAPRYALPFVAVSPLLLGSLVATHFDFWPTAFVVGALAAFVRQRHRLGWAALALAITIKLFAVVLVPLAVVWTLRRSGRVELMRAVGIAAAVGAMVVVPFLALSPGGLWGSLWRQLTRPLQIETLPGAFIETFGHPTIVPSHGSLNLGGQATVEVIFTVILIAVLLALWVGFARGPAESARLVRYAAACVVAFVILGKVLSPQFMIWLVPLVALVRGRRGIAAMSLVGVAAVATQFWFPDRYYDYVDNGYLAWLVLTRDMLLVGLLSVLAFPALRLTNGDRDGEKDIFAPNRAWYQRHRRVPIPCDPQTLVVPNSALSPTGDPAFPANSTAPVGLSGEAHSQTCAPA